MNQPPYSPTNQSGQYAQSHQAVSYSPIGQPGPYAQSNQPGAYAQSNQPGPYPRNDHPAQSIAPDIHSHAIPHPTSYQPHHHQMAQLPPMPPPGAQYTEGMPMGGPPPAPPGATDALNAQAASSQSPERAQLTPEQLEVQRKNLEPFSNTDEQGRIYSLEVVQQPQRARMCGFGDKDRRPITPPPCVRLVVRSADTGKEIDCNAIEYTWYVLNVDLWSEDALREVNLVRHTTATPSISSTTPASFAQLEQTTPAYSHPVLPSNVQQTPGGYGQPMPYQAPSPVSPSYGYAAGNYVAQNPPSQYGQGPNPPSQYGQGQYYSPQEYRQDMHSSIPQLASQTYGPPRVYAPYGEGGHRLSLSGPSHSAPTGMFTRNLIGSLAASAFRLTDTEDKIGIWFILQDLSVRTEGSFRLRFSFVNVGSALSANAGAGVSKKAPVLASIFSDVFQVFSAKKFPGVCESTQLSKCFATQGIKIPIRKEGANAKGNQEDDDFD